jgi:hypothetical protein
VALLTTRDDQRVSWLLAGQALQRLLLHATAHNVQRCVPHPAPAAAEPRASEKSERATQQEQQLIPDLPQREQNSRPGSPRGISGHRGLPGERRR